MFCESCPLESLYVFFLQKCLRNSETAITSAAVAVYYVLKPKNSWNHGLHDIFIKLSKFRKSPTVADAVYFRTINKKVESNLINVLTLLKFVFYLKKI